PGRVARSLGAGDNRAAADYGVAGCWLGALLGTGLTVVGLLIVVPVVHAMGASPSVAPFAQTYLRISLLGAPFQCIALAGTGYLRGMQNTQTPLVIAVSANVLNLALEILLVYGLHT